MSPFHPNSIFLLTLWILLLGRLDSCWSIRKGAGRESKSSPRVRSSFSASAARPIQTCVQDQSLLLYRMVMAGSWSRDQFPKHFPDWRPKAHFSKVVGRSHHPLYKLWRTNERVSLGVKLFAETGSADILNGENHSGLIFDDFNGPSFPGLGKAEAEFFVDGNHSRVSIMSRLVPSPDWFIGVDSLDLCNDGNWISSLTIDAHPFDAGTDNGLTFTSPNWPTIPASTVSQLTVRSPDHPASSFYYPEREHHPPIATISFVKVKAYELSQVYKNHNPHPELSYETVALESSNSANPANNNRVFQQTNLISFRPLNLKHETLESFHQKSNRKNKKTHSPTNTTHNYKKFRKTRNCDDCGHEGNLIGDFSNSRHHRFFNWGNQQS